MHVLAVPRTCFVVPPGFRVWTSKMLDSVIGIHATGPENGRGLQAPDVLSGKHSSDTTRVE
jgi:hypothetical protein